MSLPLLLAAVVLGFLGVDGELMAPKFTEFERGIVYEQRSYFWINTRDMDVTVAERDFQAVAAKGFKNAGLRVSWGDVMMKWDPATSTPTYNESYCTKLAQLAGIAEKNGMRLIFNVHLKENVPEGTPGAVWKAGYTDIYGVNHRGAWRVGNDMMVREEYRHPVILFHSKFAACLRGHGNGVLYWKHAFESCYLFPQKENPKDVPTANSEFAAWAKANNSDLSHWSQRWNETLTSWDAIVIPHGASPKSKYGDYFRFWLLGVLKTGQYGLSIGEIMTALIEGAGGDYQPQLGFKHWKPSNFHNLADITAAELREAYDLPINVTALGYYVNDKSQLQQEPKLFNEYVDDVKSLAPSHLPILVWETGSSTFQLSEDDQVEWAKLVNTAAHDFGLLGFNWWEFIDWAPPQGNYTDNIQYHFGVHYANYTTKKVWDWFGNH